MSKILKMKKSKEERRGKTKRVTRKETKIRKERLDSFSLKRHSVMWVYTQPSSSSPIYMLDVLTSKKPKGIKKCAHFISHTCSLPACLFIWIRVSHTHHLSPLLFQQLGLISISAPYHGPMLNSFYLFFF